MNYAETGFGSSKVAFFSPAIAQNVSPRGSPVSFRRSPVFSAKDEDNFNEMARRGKKSPRPSVQRNWRPRFCLPGRFVPRRYVGNIDLFLERERCTVKRADVREEKRWMERIGDASISTGLEREAAGQETARLAAREGQDHPVI